ncbi:MAG: DUF6036 family nucleotidyltransferase [Actinomycetota bacterium]
MNRTELAHVLRAAANVAGDGRILVIGSQAILATYPADELPETVTMSVEADIAFFDDAYNTKSDMVDGAIGEDSMFHQTFGYYGQGVSVSTATLPEGWEDRLVDFTAVDSEPAEGVCLDPVDLVVAKLVAGREKDLSFAADLVSSDHVTSAELRERTELLRVVGAVKRRVLGSIDRLDRRRG